MIAKQTQDTGTLTGLRSKPNIPKQLGRLARKKPMGALGAFIIIIIVFAAVFAEIVAPYGPYEQHLADSLAAPSSKYLLGADNFGRDMLSRIIFGARISLYVSILAVTLASATGGILGLTAAYMGGRFDFYLLRFIDITMAFPSLVLALVIVATLGPSLNNVILAIAISQVSRDVRVIRSGGLSVKENDYVLAAHAMGAKGARIIFRHMVPNVVSVWIVIATAELGGAILAESSLSFLGLGTPPPTPSWGAMLAGDSRRYMEAAPWLSIYPGLAITAAVFGFNLFGDGLRDVLDPRLRGR